MTFVVIRSVYIVLYDSPLIFCALFNRAYGDEQTNEKKAVTLKILQINYTNVKIYFVIIRNPFSMLVYLLVIDMS